MDAETFEHGLIGHRRGCRCETCKEGRAAYDRERAARRAAEAAERNFPHGTDTGWCRGCTCERCTARHAEFMAEDRAWTKAYNAERRRERARERRAAAFVPKGVGRPEDTAAPPTGPATDLDAIWAEEDRRAKAHRAELLAKRKAKAERAGKSWVG